MMRHSLNHETNQMLAKRQEMAFCIAGASLVRPITAETSLLLKLLWLGSETKLFFAFPAQNPPDPTSYRQQMSTSAFLASLKSIPTVSILPKYWGVPQKTNNLIILVSRNRVVVPASINDALQCVRNRNTYRAAETKLGILPATLQRRLHAAVQKQSRSCAFTTVEKQIIRFLLENASEGLPMTQENLGKAIQILISRMPAAPSRFLPAEWSTKAPSNAFCAVLVDDAATNWPLGALFLRRLFAFLNATLIP